MATMYSTTRPLMLLRAVAQRSRVDGFIQMRSSAAKDFEKFGVVLTSFHFWLKVLGLGFGFWMFGLRLRKYRLSMNAERQKRISAVIGYPPLADIRRDWISAAGGYPP